MNRGEFGAPSYGSTKVSYTRTPSARENNKFNRLCDNVSGKIFLINKNVSKLEALSKSVDSSCNEKDSESKIHALSQETNKLATESKNIFKEILEFSRSQRYDSFDNRQGQYYLQQNKLGKEFENSLSRYHAIQNTLSLKMKENIEQEITTSHDTSITNDDNRLQNQLLIKEDKLNQQVQLEAELAETKEREARLLQIEEDILNVNEIFRDLALLVHEQGETIDSIESNIEHAAISVGEGNKQLLRAKAYQKSARKRLCIIAVVVIVVALVLGLIIYFATKK